MARQERKLAAILVADVAGYSRLMEADEAGALATLKRHREELFDPKVKQYGGRVVGTAGDGQLVEFPSVVDAVQCAVEVQQGMSERNADVPADRRMEFRIGVNLGDVIVDGADIHGDGVNVAARLQQIAIPGGVSIAGTVREHIAGKVPYTFDDGGEQQVKNIARPVRVFRLRRDGPVDPPHAPIQADDTPLPSIPSVAVLPFTNMSGDPEQAYFSDGITEDIITELSRFKNFLVIARNSSFAFKGKSVSVKDVGRSLGAQFVVEGSVRKAGSRIRVTAQLIDAATGSHLWAERYDRTLEDIFAVQDELTDAIVAALPVRIAAALVRRSRHKPTERLDAYDLYLRARELADQHRQGDLPRAKALLQQAIERDPGYARAHAWLADLHVQTWWRTDAAGDLESAEQASARAVRLDPEDSVCHACRGQVLLFRRDYDRALHHFERASELNPNDADNTAMMAEFLEYSGRAQDAIERLHQAMRLNPLHPHWYLEILGKSLLLTHRYEDAIKAYSGIGEPAYYVHACWAGCLAKIGRRDEARLHRDRMLETKPDWTPDHFRQDPYRNAEDIEHIGELMRLVAAL